MGWNPGFRFVGPQKKSVHSIRIPVYITISGYTDGSKVYGSTNAGEDWENISGSLPNVSTGAIEIYKNIAGGLFVGTDAGVFIATTL